MFFFFRKNNELQQNDTEPWRDQWRSLVAPECRNVPVNIDGRSAVAFVQVHPYVMMLQDGLLMEQSFFEVCDIFQKAGYHVIWLMRCTQDISNGYLKKLSTNGNRTTWLWKSPTTNFGRWTSDNFNATILLQCEPLPEGDLRECDLPILQRVTWAATIPRR